MTGLQSGKGGGLGGYDPEPWTALDTVMFGKLQAWALGGNYDAELFRLLADARLGDPALTDLLVPAYPDGAPTITRTSDLVREPRRANGRTRPRRPRRAVPRIGRRQACRRLRPASRPSATASARWPASTRGRPPWAIRGVGSNNWVVGPAKSATGKALLANDPHLGVQMPSIWYMNALHCRVVSTACPYDVAGVSFPSAPGVVLGHNARIAWGVTNTGPDVQDLFVETRRPGQPGQLPLQGRVGPVRDARRRRSRSPAATPSRSPSARRSTGRSSTTSMSDLADAARCYAFRWTALAEPDGALGAFLRIDAASTFAEFRDALRSYVAPAQNFVYADLDGNIGYQMPGRDPHPAGGRRRPPPGRRLDGDHDWTGYVPFDELPTLYNPPDGLIVTANNNPVDAAYPYHLGNEWDAGWRATRIRQLLDAAAAEGGVDPATTSRRSRATPASCGPTR